MTVDLGQGAPISSTQRPAADSSKPTTSVPQRRGRSRQWRAKPPLRRPGPAGKGRGECAGGSCRRGQSRRHRSRSRLRPLDRPALPKLRLPRTAHRLTRIGIGGRQEIGTVQRSLAAGHRRRRGGTESLQGHNRQRQRTGRPSACGSDAGCRLAPSHSPAPKASPAAPAVAASIRLRSRLQATSHRARPHALAHAPAATPAPKAFAPQEPASKVTPPTAPTPKCIKSASAWARGD